MRHSLSISLLCMLAVLGAFACGSSNTGGNSDGGDGGMDAGNGTDGGDAGPVDAGSIILQGQIADVSDGGPLGNFEICVTGFPSPDCVTNGGGTSGSWSLTVPVETVDAGSYLPLAWTATADGYLGLTYLDSEGPYTAGGLPVFQSLFELMSDAAATTWATAAGFTYPASSTGFIGIYLCGPTAPCQITGATATLSPASGVGPIYGDANGPNKSLTSTSSGWIYFGNVTPGKFTVTLSDPGHSCATLSSSAEIQQSWPPVAANTVNGLVVAGSETLVQDVFCQ